MSENDMQKLSDAGFKLIRRKRRVGATKDLYGIEVRTADGEWELVSETPRMCRNSKMYDEMLEDSKTIAPYRTL